MKIHGNKNRVSFYFKITIIFLLFFGNIFAKEKKEDADLDFKMNANKQEAFVGESILITFIFKHKLSLKIAEADFAPPTFAKFWIKPGKNVPNIIKEGYNIYTLNYLITPQVAGDIEIQPARMDIGLLKYKQKNTLRFERVKYKSLFSNPLKIKVKSLPENITLFGDYNISALIDKREIRANEPVNLTLKIEGIGNIDEIEDFVIKNENAEVFSDTPKRKNAFETDRNFSVMTQKFAFVSDRNFTIEPIFLKFFDSKTKKIKTISTKKIHITVKGSSSKKHTLLYKENKREFYKERNFAFLALISIGSFFLGVAITLFWTKRKKRKKIFIDPQIEIKKSKNLKSLLQILLPYSGKSKEIDKIVKKIEENLYEAKNHKIDKKLLAKNFKKFVTMKEEEDILL